MSQSAVVLRPEADQEAVKTLIRAFQQEIIDADPYTFMGALTKDYPPDAYVSVRGQGRYLLNAPTNRLIAAQLASALLTQFGTSNPNPPRLTDTPTAYELQRHIDETGTMNGPVKSYLTQFAQALQTAGFRQTFYLPGQINDYTPAAWIQRDLNGNAGDRISYASTAARAFSVSVLVQALQDPVGLGQVARFEVNNEGWQVNSDGLPYIYDAAAQDGFGTVPEPKISNVHTADATQAAYLIYLNSLLTGWQDALGTSVLTGQPTAQVGISIDAVKVLEPESANVLALNQAVTHWSSPRYNFIRVEDNSWVAAGETSRVSESFDLALEQLGYGIGQVSYTLGPVGSSSNLRRTWRNVDDAWGHALEAEVPTVYLWDYSAVSRDSVIVTTAKICGC